MSTQNEKLGQKDTCQYYCKQVDAKGLCSEAGTGAGPLTTTDGSQDGSLLRFCWLKDEEKSQERRQNQAERHLEQEHKQRQRQRGVGPWINMDL